MLVLTQISGFGVANGPDFLTTSGSDSNANTANFDIDVGPPGKKQIIVAVGRYDDDVSDQFNTVARIDGDGMTELEDAGAFNGVDRTCASALYTYETTKGGIVDLEVSTGSFAGTLDTNLVGVLVLRGYSTTPVATKAEANGQGGTNGNSISIGATGASLVVISGSDMQSTPGDVTGDDTWVNLITSNRITIAYALNPGSGTRNYDFTADTDAIVVASFAKA